MADTRDSPEAKIRLLSQTFPCLWEVPGSAPWDARAFDAWGASGTLRHGELVPVQFILAVRDSNHDWRSGRFGLMDALSVWDSTHRAAFVAWASNPWWP